MLSIKSFMSETTYRENRMEAEHGFERDKTYLSNIRWISSLDNDG